MRPVPCEPVSPRLTVDLQVGDLKKKIQETQTFPAENQKLIYSGKLLCIRVESVKDANYENAYMDPGKILNDLATVSSLKVKEKDFLVVMVSKVGLGSVKLSPPTPAY